MSSNIHQIVLQTIADCKRIPVENVTIDTQFADIEVDSLDAIEILFTLEQRLNLVIPDDQVHSVKNVRQMVEGLEKLAAAASSGPTAAA